MDREHILSEIRRTTVANGGTPLGRDRFLAETGIKEHDWMQFWPRWSDTVRAAGLEPTNQFNQAIPDDLLLQKLADLVRALGKFPVVGEMQVNARADRTFPSTKTYRKFGGMRTLEAKLKQFAQTHGYDDVAMICRDVVKLSSAAKPSGRQTPIAIGSVYLMKSGKFYKIGHTNAVGRRERELAIQLPDKITVIHQIQTDDPSGIEDYWHRRFATRRRNGEWFDLGADDVSAFRRRKFM
jgi:hypothetical protein